VEQGAGAEGSGRGRRYDEYIRRRDERLRLERKQEAEMKALWARLDRQATTSSHGRDQVSYLASILTLWHHNVQPTIATRSPFVQFRRPFSLVS
jgi:hypothetical protein